jgi:hypothetical protein
MKVVRTRPWYRAWAEKEERECQRQWRKAQRSVLDRAVSLSDHAKMGIENAALSAQPNGELTGC